MQRPARSPVDAQQEEVVLGALQGAFKDLGFFLSRTLTIVESAMFWRAKPPLKDECTPRLLNKIQSQIRLDESDNDPANHFYW